MKSFARILSLMIIFEMILGPLPQTNMGFIQNAFAEDCQSGFVFDSTLNRCLTSEQTAQVMNSVSTCNGDKSCYKTNAENALKEAEQEGKIKEALGKKGGLMGQGMKMAAIAVPLLMGVSTLAMKKKEGATCPGISLYLMMGAGVAAFAGDTIATKQHKSRLKKIKKEWDEIIASSSNSTSTSTTSTSTTTTTSTDSKVVATEGQSQAFEMLAKSEDSMAKAAKLKSMTYGVATLAFGAAAVMSTLEAMKPTAAAEKCKIKKTPDSQVQGNIDNAVNADFSDVKPDGPSLTKPATTTFNIYKIQQRNLFSSQDLASFMTLKDEIDLGNSYQSATLDQYEQNLSLIKNSGIENDRSILSLIKSVVGKVYSGIDLFPSALAAEPATAAAGEMNKNKGTVSKMGDFLSKPITRAVIAGVFTVWSGLMTMHAMKQAKIAKNRAAYLRQIKDDFNDASSAIGCTDAQRASPSVPSCYCYTAEGARSTERANSSVCTALFTGKSVSAVETNYLSGATTGSVIGCVTSTGAQDTTCSCKTTNTCLSSSVSGITGLDTGSFSVLSSSLTPVDQLGNGTLAEGTVSAEGAVSKAIRLLDTAEKTAAKSAAGQEINKNKAALANDMANSLMTSAAGYSPSSLGSGFSSLPSNPASAALELEKELKQSSPINTAGNQNGIATPSNEGVQQLDFGLAGEETKTEASQIAEVMGQNLDYGQNDINKGSTTNLFEVLSNRYQRSGMRRLFDETGKTKADKPAQTDITK